MSMNPLLPAPLDAVYTGFAVLAVLATVVAAVQVVRAPVSLERRLLWLLVVLLIPILGMLAWYLEGAVRCAAGARGVSE